MRANSLLLSTDGCHDGIAAAAGKNTLIITKQSLSKVNKTHQMGATCWTGLGCWGGAGISFRTEDEDEEEEEEEGKDTEDEEGDGG